MKKGLIILVIGIAFGVVGYYIAQIDSSRVRPAETTEYIVRINDTPDFGFSYRSDPQGYVVEEMASVDEKHDLKKSIVILPLSDKQPQDSVISSEGSPAITINVFKNTKKQWPATWAIEHEAYSAFNLKMGSTTEVVVGGANAIRYKADGLYASDNVVVAQGQYIYVITGMFIDADSDLKRDFEPLLSSLYFLPVTTNSFEP